VARPSHPRSPEMRILCAWCCREGQPGYLGEREPLDNPEPTHGVCPHHKAELLESLPSRSFPQAELLIIVRRENTALYEQFKRVFTELGVSHVKVIQDRRVADRRAVLRPESYERRRMRRRRVREAAISLLGGFTIVRFTPKARPTPELLEIN
jgi:hypothetical protein